MVDDVREGQRINQKRYRERHAGRTAEASRRWRARNPEKKKEYHRRRQQNDPAYRQRRVDAALKRKYGLTTVERDAMLKEQNFQCKICGTENPGDINWHIDHCHTSGKIRGLLCRKCNIGLGCFQDNIEFLKRACEYLAE